MGDLKKKNKDKYAFIVKSGKGFQNILYSLFKTVWECERRPMQWINTIIIQLYKGKGDKCDFSNQRFIHMKEDIPKSFEQIVVTKMKPFIIKNVSKYQIGAIPGHQSSEHLFTLKSVIALYTLFDIPIIMQFYDLKKYFDSESLRAAM